jgi:glycosyltransferase involved in cell wall biosynthesis
VDAFQTARVAVLPSVHTSKFGGPYAKPELLGLTLIEAMACGTPVIASSAASLPEVVVDGSTGFIFDAGDSSALRACLRRLWNDDQLWYRMSDAALTRVRDRFTWPKTAIRALEGYATTRR